MKRRAPPASARVKRRIMIGTYVLSAAIMMPITCRAQKVRTLIKRDFGARLPGGVDAIRRRHAVLAFGIADEDLAADPVKST